ncbi:EcsC family protein, partial [Paenisporosarcina sp. TG20]|uniref:EcsC family protein n=1 Tax=Paenisporosarcina sp. TG20 TaxID=1211706 RepID=UPI000593AADD
MDDYMRKVEQELYIWRHKMNRKSSLISRASKTTQTRINGLLPEKFHNIMTESIKNMV